MPAGAASKHRARSHSASPRTADAAGTGRILRIFSLALPVITTPIMLFLVVVAPNAWLRWVGVLVCMYAISATVIVLTNRGRTRAAAWTMTLGVWVLFTAAAFTTGGVDSPAIAGQLVVVALAGLLLGWRYSVYAGVAAAATTVTLAYLQVADRLPANSVAPTPWSRALTLMMFVAMLGVLQAMVVRTLDHMRLRALHDSAGRRSAESRLRQVVENAPFGALDFQLQDGDKLVTVGANLSASSVLERDATRLLGTDAQTVLAGPGGTLACREIMRIAHDGGVWESDDFAWRISGETRAFEIHAFQTGADRAALFFSDVTERRRAEAEIRHMAFHDELTGLPNRALFYDHLHMALASAQRRGDHVGLLFLDLDGFKALNDRYGHGFGDELLVTVASRLRQSARRGDTVARFGGDEFAVLLPDVESPQQAEAAARKVLAMLEEPIEIANRTARIGASIGVAIAPHASRDAATLVHQADLAMYQVKADGRGGYRFYDASAEHQARRRTSSTGPSAAPVADETL